MTDTRDLSQDERGVLLKLLPAGLFPGAKALERQVSHTSVVCGSPQNFLDLQVDDSAEAADVPDGPAPLSGLVQEPGSTEPVGEITVWVERGRLAALEHASFMDEEPGPFPSPERITVQLRSGGALS
jgi:hypothetical protein